MGTALRIVGLALVGTLAVGLAGLGGAGLFISNPFQCKTTDRSQPALLMSIETEAASRGEHQDDADRHVQCARYQGEFPRRRHHGLGEASTSRSGASRDPRCGRVGWPVAGCLLAPKGASSPAVQTKHREMCPRDWDAPRRRPRMAERDVRGLRAESLGM